MSIWIWWVRTKRTGMRNYLLSIFVHIVLFLLLLGFAFTKPIPKEPVQHAIIVDFSQLDDVSDVRDDMPAPQAPATKARPAAAKSAASAPAKATKVSEQPKQTLRTSQKPIADIPAKATQQEAPVVKKVISPPAPTPEEIEAERRAKEKAAKKSQFQSLLSKAKGTSKSDNSADLDAEAEALESIGSELLHSGGSTASTGRGILGNRKVLKVPTIKDQSQKKGRVVVQICVNAAGKVVSAKYTMLGSTTNDAYLIKLAEEGAMQYLFSESDHPRECGKVTIDFQLK